MRHGYAGVAESRTDWMHDMRPSTERVLRLSCIILAIVRRSFDQFTYGESALAGVLGGGPDTGHVAVYRLVPKLILSNGLWHGPCAQILALGSDSKKGHVKVR